MRPYVHTQPWPECYLSQSYCLRVDVQGFISITCARNVKVSFEMKEMVMDITNDVVLNFETIWTLFLSIIRWEDVTLNRSKLFAL